MRLRSSMRTGRLQGPQSDRFTGNVGHGRMGGCLAVQGVGGLLLESAVCLLRVFHACTTYVWSWGLLICMITIELGVFFLYISTHNSTLFLCYTDLGTCTDPECGSASNLGSCNSFLIRARHGSGFLEFLPGRRVSLLFSFPLYTHNLQLSTIHSAQPTRTNNSLQPNLTKL